MPHITVDKLWDLWGKFLDFIAIKIWLFLVATYYFLRSTLRGIFLTSAYCTKAIVFVYRAFRYVPLILWILVFSFIVPSLLDNPLTCSYLRNEIFSNDYMTLVGYISCICFLLCRYITKMVISYSIKNFKENVRPLIKVLIKLIISLCLKFWLITGKTLNIVIISSKLNLIRLDFKKFIYKCSNYKISVIILDLSKLFNDKMIVSYLIFKTYSVFGFYKITRFNYIDLKNEGFKNLKY